jgi:hypothetical protein
VGSSDRWARTLCALAILLLIRIICNVIDFKVGVEIISSHMPLLVELGNIMEEEFNTK